MKLIILILDERDAEPISTALGESGYEVTHVASTGGFMRRGNCTFLVGTEDDKVDDALVLMRDTMSRMETRDHQRAMAFILKVDKFQKI